MMETTIKIKQKRNEKQDSFMLSIFIHMLLLLLFLIPILSAFNKAPEPPQFQGIQVALGVPMAEERTENKSAAAEPESQPKAQPKASAAKPSYKSKAKPKAQPKATPQKIQSKTIADEAPIVATKTAAQKAEEKKNAKEKAEKRAKEKAEDERQAKIAEAQRKANEEAQRKAKEAADAKAKKQAAKSKFNQLLKNSNADGAASKGDPKGRPNAAALEGMTTGKGKAGKGLGSRGLVYAPVINDNSQMKGKVVVIICVNAKGKVTTANYTQKGTTTTDSHLIALATDNAKKYKFSPSSQEEQCGEILIDFKLR